MLLVREQIEWKFGVFNSNQHDNRESSFDEIKTYFLLILPTTQFVLDDYLQNHTTAAYITSIVRQFNNFNNS